MLMSLRTQKKRTRTKCLWLLRSVVHCYVMNFVYNQKRCTLLRHELCLQSEALYIVTSWTLFTIRSVVHCYVMNFVYNQKRCTCTLLRHELCLQSWSHTGAKTTPTFCVQELIRARLHCYHAYSVVTSWTSKRAVVNEWGFVVFAQNPWKLIPSVINFKDFLFR